MTEGGFKVRYISNASGFLLIPFFVVVRSTSTYANLNQTKAKHSYSQENGKNRTVISGAIWAIVITVPLSSVIFSNGRSDVF